MKRSLPLRAALLVAVPWLGACDQSPQSQTLDWQAPSAAEQRAWKEAAGTDPQRDAPDILAATLDFPAQTHTVAYATLRSDRDGAEVTLKDLSAELKTRFPQGQPKGEVYQERWLVGRAQNSQCAPQQLRLLTMAGELPPREGQEWTGALGLLPDPEPCSGVQADAVSASVRKSGLQLNEWNVVQRTELSSKQAQPVVYAVAVYPTDAALPLPAGAAADELVWLEGRAGAPLDYAGLKLPALPDPHAPLPEK
ncbi:hypothetical protein [Deinococcus sp. Marseille-Q6407]|uniref:hypothetical protein n=1 Tax=Deinococcus sp. Marseille-Q6407 TaxID=2969223 RepID=UPI0021BE9C0B|nr:hypothetical protein [Deinococcus sp. Marseille-Q6407]